MFPHTYHMSRMYVATHSMLVVYKFICDAICSGFNNGESSHIGSILQQKQPITLSYNFSQSQSYIKFTPFQL